MCVVLPPGAAHKSRIFSLGWGSRTWATTADGKFYKKKKNQLPMILSPFRIPKKSLEVIQYNISVKNRFSVNIPVSQNSVSKSILWSHWTFIHETHTSMMYFPYQFNQKGTFFPPSIQQSQYFEGQSPFRNITKLWIFF